MDWIKTKDKLPDEYTEVLAVYGEDITVATYCTSDKYSWVPDVDGITADMIPDYWMPLPRLPENDT